MLINHPETDLNLLLVASGDDPRICVLLDKKGYNNHMKNLVLLDNFGCFSVVV